MKKIVVIGPPGAGKTTFARMLSKILDIEVYHLDRLFWLPGWKERSKKERIAILQQLVQKESWIIEGSYFSTSDIRLVAADTIIFLDLPRLLCLGRVFKRHFVNRRMPRPDLPEGCADKLGLLYIVKILVFPLIGRRTLMRKFGTIKDRNIINLCSRADVRAFLIEQSAQRQARSVLCEQRHKVLQRAVRACTSYLNSLGNNLATIYPGPLLTETSPNALWAEVVMYHLV